MIMNKTPMRGDILHLTFDPSSGKEIQGNRFCVVVSPVEFNKRFKLAWVCPISRGESLIARDSGFLVSLMGFGLQTDGAIHLHQLKSLDWVARKAHFVERIPDILLQEITEKLILVLEN